MGGFDYGIGADAREVGELVHSVINLETPVKPMYLLADGRTASRSLAPELATPERFPIGVFTSTLRTLNAIPMLATIAADSTNFLSAGAAGTSPLQASPDAATWTTSATWTAATSPAVIIRAGTRFVMAGSGGDLTQPYVSNIDQTAANQVAKANWTVTTGGTTPTTTNLRGLVYGSTANAGAGRTLLIRQGTLTTAAGLFYMNDGATAWSACSGGSSMYRLCSCWTGQKALVFAPNGQLYQSSSDMATFTDNYFPFLINAVTDCASDGNGTVVVSANIATSNQNNYIWMISKDHGVTWRAIPVRSEMVSMQGAYVNYVNGRFIAHAAADARLGTFLSKDCIAWFTEPVAMRGLSVTTANFNGAAYKSGVYCFVNQSTTDALTATEDMSKFRVPLESNTMSVTTINRVVFGNVFIKARSK